MTQAVVDRYEEGVAVLLVGDDQAELLVSADHLPPQVREGTWLRVQLEDGNLVSAAIDQEETDRVSARISDKLAKLRARGRNPT